MTSAQLAALLLIFPLIGKCFSHGGPSVKWGSSVVTETSGPSPILRYITDDEPSVYLDGEELNITNGSCFLLGDKVGEPCSFTNDSEGFLTEIRLSSVTNHTMLTIEDISYHSTFFAPDCVFPTPVAGTVMPQVSLPLSRFMGGYGEVNITFAAFVGQTNFSIELYEGDEVLCHFNNSQTAEENPQFCQVTFRNDNKEVWFNGKFNKCEYEWETYEWHLDESFVSVFVNWTHTGNSPEDGVCSRNDETTENEMHTTTSLTDLVMPNCVNEMKFFSGVILFVLLNLLY
ncbi:hypothetical protein AAHC03_010321 [Spirometra sp. Aus1]